MPRDVEPARACLYCRAPLPAGHEEGACDACDHAEHAEFLTERDDAHEWACRTGAK